MILEILSSRCLQSKAYCNTTNTIFSIQPALWAMCIFFSFLPWWNIKLWVAGKENRPFSLQFCFFLTGSNRPLDTAQNLSPSVTYAAQFMECLVDFRLEIERSKFVHLFSYFHRFAVFQNLRNLTELKIRLKMLSLS